MRALATVLLLALAIAGCGGTARDSAKKFKGDSQRVAAAVESLESAARARKPDIVCTKLLTPARLATLKQQGTNCKTAVKEAFADADSLDLTVDKVAITGGSATATVISGTGSKKKTDTLELKRSGSTWQIDSLGS